MIQDLASRGDEAYAYAMGRIRSLETRLFDRARLDRLIDAPTHSEAFRQLCDGEYGQDAESLAAVDIDILIGRHASRTYQNLLGMVPDPTAVNFLAVRFDMEDAKRTLRDEGTGTLWRIGPISAAKPDPATPLELPEHLTAFIDVVRSSSDSTPSLADAAVNRAGFSLMKRLAQASGSALLLQLWALFADTANILAIVRGKAVGRNMVDIRPHLVAGSLTSDILSRLNSARMEEIPGTIRGSAYEIPVARGIRTFIDDRRLDILETELDNLVMTSARSGRTIAMGPEVVTGYLIAKEHEWKNIRLIFLGRSVGLDPDQIRQRLRDAYV